MAATAAAKNRKIRQEALREQLAEQCRLQHVLENIKKMEQQGAKMDNTELQAIKAATDARIKLIGKYLPDLKAQEITGADGMPLGVIDMSNWSDEDIDEYIAKHSK